MARKPLPPEVKRARGETRPSQASVKVIDFPASEKMPEPPSWLKSKDGRALWKEIAGQLFAQRVMSDVDRHSMAHLCQLHGEIVSGYRRKVKPTAAELSQLRMYFSEFGLTPSSRIKVGAGRGKEEDNKFKKNQSRPTAE